MHDILPATMSIVLEPAVPTPPWPDASVLGRSYPSTIDALPSLEDMFFSLGPTTKLILG